ncbi:MAG TPA: tetraacyldisaccharide 4'-kinase [Aliidongia sp.]|nr:tetraacyldisaccharide 4'-kinase [Aliidongia sp.]
MRAPEFWTRRGWESAALAPAAALFDTAGRIKRALATPWRAPVPVVCVGNLTVGGAGKTPVVLALAQALGVNVHLLTRGYGGSLAGPVRVDPARHDFRAVGDEPLLLARAAPTWVARDRAAGAKAAVAAGAGLILMDDGLQNPSLRQDLRLIVVDGGYGFGNGRVLPAGPLREDLRRGLARVHGAILVGDDRAGAGARLAGLPMARARLAPRNEIAGRVLAFAGIGRPRKFFETLEAIGAELVERVGFPDHHPYGAAEIEALLARAEALRATPVTTAKDAIRLPPGLRERVAVLEIELAWASVADEAAIMDLLTRL